MAAAAAAAAFSVSFPSHSHRSSSSLDAGSAAAAAAASSSSSSCSGLLLQSNARRKPRRYPATIRATTSSSRMPHHQQYNSATTTSTPVPASPLRTAEDLAARLGLDLAVAGLERLFSSPSHSPLAPVPTTVGGDGDDTPHPDPSPRRPLRVAYQGTRGSYCQEAAAAAFSSLPRSHLAAFPCAQMEDAFAALEDGAADRAVVPAENSLDGPIHRNLDLLLRHPRVEVVGELVLPVNHCLLALPGDCLASIRRVASHPQALAHCGARLSALGVETEEAPNAAEAARALAEGRLRAGTAVVGSRAAVEEFGPVVLEENLQDPAAGGNHTRFLQLALRHPDGSLRGQVAAAGAGRRKATVAFSLEKGPSELFRAMWAFESRGLAVTRVDHRPNRENPVRFVERAGERVGYFDYVFVLDVEWADGSARVDPVELDSAVEVAVERLREICGFVRVVGTYTCVTAC